MQGVYSGEFIVGSEYTSAEKRRFWTTGVIYLGIWGGRVGSF